VTVGPTFVHRDAHDELRAVARRLIAQRCSLAATRDIAETPAGFAPDVWDAIAATGWIALEIPEIYGGSGAGFAACAVILEELGRLAVPLPYLSTAVLGVGALIHAGSPEQCRAYLPGIASGRIRATLVAGFDHTGVGLADSGLRYRRLPGGDLIVAGTARFVPDAHTAHILVAAAAGETGPCAVIVPAERSGIEIQLEPTVDRTRRLCSVRLSDVHVRADEQLAIGQAARELVSQLLDRAAVAVACDSVAGAEQVLAMTVSYAKTRRQFGRPIGTFQAIKHHCADMAVLVETAQVAASLGVKALDHASTGEGIPWPSAAKAYCTDAYAAAAGTAVQVHGGIGFTWEHDVHLYLKRAKLNQALFGSPRWHRTRVGQFAWSRAAPQSVLHVAEHS
jgi:alkylation response protein AidB-like acyl-CoA dehydrogenase